LIPALGDGDTLTLDTTAIVAGGTPQSLQGAFVSHSGRDPDSSNDSDEARMTPPVADLRVKVSTDTNTPPRGVSTRFTVTATNNGPKPAANVVVDLKLPDALALTDPTASAGTYTAGSSRWAIPRLASGSSATLTAKGSVRELGPQSLKAVISAEGTFDPTADNDSDSDFTTVAALMADFAIAGKVDRSSTKLGAVRSFTFTATNRGANTATGNVRIRLPAGVQFVDASTTDGSYDSESGRWSLPEVSDGESSVIKIMGKVKTRPQQLAAATMLSSSLPDPEAANDSNSISVKAPQVNLALDGIASPSRVKLGGQSQLKLGITNSDLSENASDIVVKVKPADGLAINVRGLTATVGRFDSKTSEWRIPLLKATQRAELTVTGAVNSYGSRPLKAMLAASGQDDPQADDNAASADVAAPHADLSVAIDDPTAYVHLGESTVATVRLANSGPDDAGAATVAVAIPTGFDLVSVDGDGSYDRATGVWAAGDVTAGGARSLGLTLRPSGRNIETLSARIASSDANDTEPANDSASLAIGAPSADLALAASASTESPEAGKPFTLNLTVTNNSSVTASGVKVVTGAPAGVQLGTATQVDGSFDSATGVWAVDSLKPGGSAQLAVEVTPMTEGDAAFSPSITSSGQDDPDSSNNSASIVEHVIAATATDPVAAVPPVAAAAASVEPPASDGGKDAGRHEAFDPTKHPVKTLGAAAAGLAVLAATGAAAGAAGAAAGASAGAGAAGGGAAGGGAAGGSTQGDGSGGPEIEFRKGALSADQRAELRLGDRSVTWQTPAHTVVDALGVALPLAVARKSSLATGVMVDGAHVRAMFGSIWAAGAVTAAAAGIFAAGSVDGHADVPKLAFFLLILALGIIDAAWGGIAALTFVVSVLAGHGVESRPDALTLMSMSAAWTGIALITGKIRPYRRKHQDDLHFKWVQAGDFIVAPVIAYWLAGAVAGLIPTITGKSYPTVTDHLQAIQLVAGGAMFVRVGLEYIARTWYPKRLAHNLPADLPGQSTGYGIVALFARMGVLVFIAWDVIGNCWQLWATLAIFTVGEAIKMVRHTFPSSTRLYPFIPRDLIKILVILILATEASKLLAGRFSDPLEMLRWGLMISMLPSFLVRFAESFARTGTRPVNWPIRIAGVGGLVAFVLVAGI
jgi:uncharacterized repeat protein (TIGR01451 family)